MKIITADQRLAEKSGAKILIVGPSGVGKTSLLRTMSTAMLASTLFVDIEAGDIAVSDLPVASVRPRTWVECRDLACVLGGFNPALPANVAYSEAHFNEVMKNSELAQLFGLPNPFRRQPDRSRPALLHLGGAATGGVHRPGSQGLTRGIRVACSQHARLAQPISARART